jgi:hypothetical protein
MDFTQFYTLNKWEHEELNIVSLGLDNYYCMINEY